MKLYVAGLRDIAYLLNLPNNQDVIVYMDSIMNKMDFQFAII
ncbi:hypothetical protein HMPREF9720_1287 [Alistipes sp. HGB5]|nr:hypothetical protein HMPREF9720_1287 [Alistipes sp. HGB5]